ncbi:MAG: HNH endonuclease [Actinomycetota bacterium]|nr:HNH endonuclease [Actinomycetota bacterium]
MFENVTAEGLLKAVREHDFDPHDDPMGADRIDAIKAFDRVIRSAQAAQARQIAALDAERAARMTLGRGDHSLSVIGEIGMARNISPSAAGSHYGFAVGLARMPQVAAVFAAAKVSEQAARLVVRESTGLDLDQVTRLDKRPACRISGLIARKAGDLARHYAIGIDADAAYQRATANRADRFVSLFSDTDGVAILQVRGPAEQMLAAFNALDHASKSAKTAGDDRTRGQVMCDEFVQRVTGLKKATDVSVEIGLVMTVGSLLRRDQLPAMLVGLGPIPSELAHNIVAAGQEASATRSTELFSTPTSDDAVSAATSPD